MINKKLSINVHTYSKVFLICNNWYKILLFMDHLEDQTIFKFTKYYIWKKKFEVYNNGNIAVDFTYIDDAVDALYVPSKFH